MRLLNFALSTAAYGDTLIGLSFTDQIRQPGIEQHFVVSEAAVPLVSSRGYDYTVLKAHGTRSAEKQIDDCIRRFRPDAMVLADYLNYWGTLIRQYDTDPWFIDRYGLPLLPIDIWEWENTPFRFDVCGRDYEREISKRILGMEAHLRPVPVGHLTPGPSGRGLPYRIMDPEPLPDVAKRLRLRADLGLASGDRLVMIPVSAWQQPDENTPGATDMMRRLADRVPDLLVHYLGRLPATTRFVFVGHVPPAFRKLPPEQVRVLPLCPPDEYRDLLAVSDLVLSLSLTALTMVRAVLMDIPSLVITNRFRVAGPADIEKVSAELGGLTDTARSWLTETAPIAPFRQWPKGLYDFVQRLFDGNDYLDTLGHGELMDEENTVARLTELLYDPSAQQRLAGARSAYLDRLAALPPTLEVFAEAARRVGLSMP
ncbi:DUF6365 family protein [Streptomyces sp. NBC_01390]|uniref:DUF6365 family protein n=1 Tax=Streptomyces sp. NBC_01390 TaxID=2903850 RepID=UPI003253CC8A